MIYFGHFYVHVRWLSAILMDKIQILQPIQKDKLSIKFIACLEPSILSFYWKSMRVDFFMTVWTDPGPLHKERVSISTIDSTNFLIGYTEEGVFHSPLAALSPPSRPRMVAGGEP
jgi:hypothetical protein